VNIHRGICNYTIWWREYLKLTGADRFLQKVPLTFDPSVAEIFGALVSGAALVIARPDLSGDTRYLIDTICEQRVTAAFFVPSLLAVFVHDKSAVQCSSLRCVISGGEALSSELKNRFYAVFRGTELVNIYGPAEAIIAVTAWRCERQSGSGPVPIGRPIANTRLYILNWAMEPVPVGVAGELHIGGVQVARGYLARPELTAKAFVPNPFGEGRLYKTSDLACYREDGAIEFLGRIDQQVKLRGLRIETGEIEAALDRHPAVRKSVVIVRNGTAESNKGLVAYVAAEGLSTSELRQHLQKSLPQSMIPSSFAFIDKLPLTRNGKIDLQALPAPEFKRNEGDFVAPRDLLESQLVTLWEKALGVRSIGVTDDFF
jgi:amino acid adenylation domain-containing protein